MAKLSCPHELLDQMVRHAQRGIPLEICGLVGGRAGRAYRVVEVPNVDSAPQVRFTMDRRAMVAAILDFDRAGLEVVAIYHSHPATPPQPSPTDIALATWPDALYLIVNPAFDPPIRAWSIHGGRVEAAELVAASA
ncbi:MAG TPA: M67 family metallopeptidase [Aggregatilineales bacterium]|nr:M67 family metallopeptidase [Aggregatilineales bacterium]